MFFKSHTTRRQTREAIADGATPAGPTPVAIVKTATAVLVAVTADELSRILTDLKAAATPATVEIYIGETLVSARSTTHPGNPTNVFDNFARFTAEHPELVAA